MPSMLVASTFGGLLLFAAVDQPPALNIGPTCASAVSDSWSTATPGHCERSEQEAQDKLGSEWSQFPGTDRRCTRVEKVDPMPTRSLAGRSLAPSSFGATTALSRAQPVSAPENDGPVLHAPPGLHGRGISSKGLVEISPAHAVACRGAVWNGVAAQIVQETSREFVEYRFQAPVHMLIAHEQGARHEGETFAEGLPQSTRRNMAQKLTFVPAGHAYRETHYPRVLSNALYVYIDPCAPELTDDGMSSEAILRPRLFFDDESLWGTASKLKRVLEDPSTEDRLYVEALGSVLAHELARMSERAGRKGPMRGGLASWQQRIVTTYIEEHLAEPIPLAALAGMVRLSQFYFCRAFKQSLGVPPHRYHMTRRIERAKALLAEQKYSVNEIGLALGFSDASSFTASFRRLTGSTPSKYGRSLI